MCRDVEALSRLEKRDVTDCHDRCTDVPLSHRFNSLERSVVATVCAVSTTSDEMTAVKGHTFTIRSSLAIRAACRWLDAISTKQVDVLSSRRDRVKIKSWARRYFAVKGMYFWSSHLDVFCMFAVMSKLDDEDGTVTFNDATLIKSKYEMLWSVSVAWTCSLSKFALRKCVSTCSSSICEPQFALSSFYKLFSVQM